jgi:hypothetical protein
MRQCSHRFFLDSMYSGTGMVREVAPPPWHDGMQAELRFTYDVLELALSRINAQGLHFYFTKEAYRLPEYGRHVIAVLLQEERCKPAVYSRHVRATIRNTSCQPFSGFHPHLRMGRLEAVLAFEYARDWYKHIQARSAMNGAHRDWPAPVRANPFTIQIPLGYHSQTELPQVPMAERTLDTFFAGDVKAVLSKSDYRYWTSISKNVARTQLWRVLIDLQKRGVWNIDLNNLDSTQNRSHASSFNSYSQKMMNSRICVSPRGTLADTYRSFEGLRAGCLVVGQPVQRGSFLANAPILLLNHWSELERILKKYARNIPLLEAAREKSLAYWNEYLRPERIAESLVLSLNRAAETLL